jgi:hypothetical protein
MTYRQLLAQQPTGGTPAIAARYVATITAFLQTDDAAALSDANRNYLYRLRHKWQRRADGLDLAWGRARVRKSKETATEDVPLDPLSAELIRKYGDPANGDF